MTLTVDCIHCGKQLILDGESGEKCYWCRRPALEKGEKVAIERDLSIGKESAPPKPKKRKQLRKYWEDNKEQIIVDYNAMPLRELFNKWKLSSGTLMQLKTDWEVPSKGKRNRYTTEKQKVADSSSKIAKVTITHADYEELIYLRGYRQAVLDMAPK